MLMNNLRNFPPVTLGIFQSTLLQEERRPYVMIYDKYKLFQSTLLQEERHKLPGLSVMNRYISIHAPTRGATFPISSRQWTDWNFNPRSYKRSDGFGSRFFHAGWIISIHAPTRGATIITAERCLPEPISIHAPTRGATLKAWTEMQKQ